MSDQPMSAGHHRGPRSALHYGIVDRIAGDRFEGRSRRVEARARAMPLGHRLPHKRRHFGPVGGEFIQQMARAKREDPSVPAEIAAVEIGLRGGSIGLLDEPPDRIAARQRRAALEVAIAGLGPVSRDAEGYEIVRARQGRSRQRGGAEGVRIGNVMIARAHQHHRIVGQQCSSERNGGRGVARTRLHHQPRAGGVAQLDHGQIAMRGACHHHRRGKAIIAGHPVHRLFEQGLRAHQWQKRLGHRLAAERPEPRAAAAAQDHRVDLRHGCRPSLLF
jgi:hypothetical protein